MIFPRNDDETLQEWVERFCDDALKVLRKQVVSAGDYKYAESLCLHGDVSGN